jgi:ubiquinone/menaquinone biosynthesis C-methylase UbiE
MKVTKIEPKEEKMKDYLKLVVDTKDPNLVSVIDELPLWSAPFGLRLLDIIELKKNINVLDLGCGLGFPLIELSQRLGQTSQVYGIDPWTEALDRVRYKLQVYNIKNVKLVNGFAENMPFDTDYFDLIASNNGINNVRRKPRR